MKDIKLNDKQVIILKSLLIQEIDYLENDAIPKTEEILDKNSLEDELKNCKELLEKIR